MKRMALPSLGSSVRSSLLVTQHFHGGLPEHGEIKRGFFGVTGENNLMRQRGFAATRHARDDVEGKFRDAAAQDFVQSAHAGGKLMNLDFSRLALQVFLGRPKLAALFCVFIFASGFISCLGFHFCPGVSKSKSSSGIFGQTSRTRRNVKSSPMKATSSPSNWASRTTLPSRNSSGPTCAGISSNPASVPSACTCTARSHEISAAASVSARARKRHESRRPPSSPSEADAAFQEWGSAAGVLVLEDLFPSAS